MCGSSSLKRPCQSGYGHGWRCLLRKGTSYLRHVSISQELVEHHIPIYVPLMASAGVLKPSPTSLYHLFSFVAIFFPPAKIQDSECSEGCESAARTTGLGVLEDVLFLICLLDLKVRLGTDPIVGCLGLAHLCVSHHVAIEDVEYGECLSEAVVTCLDSAEATATKLYSTIGKGRRKPIGWRVASVAINSRRATRCVCMFIARVLLRRMGRQQTLGMLYALASHQSSW